MAAAWWSQAHHSCQRAKSRMLLAKWIHLIWYQDSYVPENNCYKPLKMIENLDLKTHHRSIFFSCMHALRKKKVVSCCMCSFLLLPPHDPGIDLQAFVQAWATACADTRSPVILVPSGKTFLIGEITLLGPCKSRIDFRVNC